MYIPAELQPPDSLPAVVQKIYTTHSSGKDAARLPILLNELDAILIDIRFTPPAQPLKWSRNYLKILLKKRYLHVPTLGDRAAENRGVDGKPSIHNLALGIKIVAELKINLLLFCSCDVNGKCHRWVISKELAKQKKEVMEISDWLKPFASG